MLRTKRGDYFIEPSKHHDTTDAGHHTHIVFQRSAVKVRCKQKNLFDFGVTVIGVDESIKFSAFPK